MPLVQATQSASLPICKQHGESWVLGLPLLPAQSITVGSTHPLRGPQFPMCIMRNQTGWSLDPSSCDIPRSATASPGIPGPPITPQASPCYSCHALLKTCLLQEAPWITAASVLLLPSVLWPWVLKEHHFSLPRPQAASEQLSEVVSELSSGEL